MKKVYSTKSHECSGCSNMCEVVELISDAMVKARWGDRCGKWSNMPHNGTFYEENKSIIV